MVENFEKNVFINCPFEIEYFPILKSIIFTIITCGFIPRIALERFDSSEIRLDKIKQLIEESCLSIHDLSKVKSQKKNEYFRLNMPFEIGLDLGCRLYHPNEKYRQKKSLILEKEKYAYQKALSDISNSDVKCHKGEPEEAVMCVRNWFSEIGNKNLASSSSIWDNYNIFYADFYKKMTLKKFNNKDIDNLPIAEFITYIQRWKSNIF